MESLLPMGGQEAAAAVLQPSKTWYIDFDLNCIRGMCDGRRAMEQAVRLALSVPRYAHVIYSFDYGHELDGLFGAPLEVAQADLPRRVGEALRQDDRIEAVQGFRFTRGEETLHAYFDVTTKEGILESEAEIKV